MTNSDFIDAADDAVADTHTSNLSAVDFLRAVVEQREGGEHRVEQETMVETVENAINEESHLLIQAGTGTGKSVGYIVPAILSGKRVAISTATKQLSEQIVNKDMPFLDQARKTLEGKGIDYALLKGRNNYFCLRKGDELERLEHQSGKNSPSGLDSEGQESLFEETPARIISKKSRGAKKGFFDVKRDETQQRIFEIGEVMDWARTTRSGDRSEAPPVSDKTWATVASTNAECPGRATCAFGDKCFAELARDRARAAQVVVANHAVVGVDMLSGNSMLGPRDVLIIDEVHELDNYLSSAWGTEMTIKTISDLVSTSRRAANANDTHVRKQIDDLADLVDELELALSRVTSGLIDVMDEDVERLLGAVAEKTQRMTTLFALLSEESESKVMKGAYKSAQQRSAEVHDSAKMLLSDSEEVVRWFYRSDRDPDNAPASMHAAPLRIGPRLMNELQEADTTMIATSATITVGGKFDTMAHNLAMDEEIEHLDPIAQTVQTYPARKFEVIDVGTPFDYPNQAMLYIPDTDDFPAPVGKDRQEHSDAVLETALNLVEASGGRALVLSTTTSGARRIGQHLRDHLDMSVLIQGDAPNAQLVDQFREEETAVLCATMGMWHGLDVVGPSLSLVIIDKIPFSPMDDPLSKARQRHAESMGRNGFMDVYVAIANIMLSQGFGRLVRSKSDRGVVAVLDTRLRTKAYGRAMLRSLPPVRIFSDEAAVIAALKRLTSSY